MKGCILAGKFIFSDETKNTNAAKTKKQIKRVDDN